MARARYLYFLVNLKQRHRRREDLSRAIENPVGDAKEIASAIFGVPWVTRDGWFDNAQVSVDYPRKGIFLRAGTQVPDSYQIEPVSCTWWGRRNYPYWLLEAEVYEDDYSAPDPATPVVAQTSAEAPLPIPQPRAPQVIEAGHRPMR